MLVSFNKCDFCGKIMEGERPYKIIFSEPVIKTNYKGRQIKHQSEIKRFEVCKDCCEGIIADLKNTEE